MLACFFFQCSFPSVQNLLQLFFCIVSPLFLGEILRQIDSESGSNAPKFHISYFYVPKYCKSKGQIAEDALRLKPLTDDDW